MVHVLVKFSDKPRLVDKEQPVNQIGAMSDIVAETCGALRFPMIPVWIFSALTMLLSAVGIFGVMSYTVNRSAHVFSSVGAARDGRATGSYLPARRASRVDPITALRYE